MICPKCGTNLADDAVFCQKCGTKVISVNSGERSSFINKMKILPKGVAVGLICFALGLIGMVAGGGLPNIIDMDGYQGVSFSSPYFIGSFVLWISGSVFMILVSKPKKKLRSFILALVSIAAVCACIIMIGNTVEIILWNQSRYVDQIKNHQPFETGENKRTWGNVSYIYTLMTPTCEDVFTYYLDPIEWVVDNKNRGSSHVAGILKGTGEEITVYFDSYLTPYALAVDNEYIEDSGEITDFLYRMFDAYVNENIFVPYISGILQKDGNLNTDSGTSLTRNQILIEGIPVADIIGMSADGVIEIFGEPESYSEYSTIEYGSSYSERMCFNLSDENTVADFVANAEKFSFNDQSLSQDFDTIVSVLGESYENRSGGRYSFPVAWTYDGCDIVFEFPIIETDECIMDIYVFPAASEEDVLTDGWNEIYTGSEVDYGYESAANLDPDLIGRWRSYDGGILEFDEYGNILNCDFNCWSIDDASPTYVYWTTNNGRVNCTAYFNMEYVYELVPPSESNEYEVLKIQGTEFYRVEGTNGEGVVGTWYHTYWSRQFNADKSGMINGRYPLTYWYTYQTESGENILSYEIEDRTYFDYTVNGNMLTVFLSDSSRIYTKVGN